LDEWVQFVREGKHDVKVRDGQQVLSLLFEPLGPLEPLTSWTMTIATGVWLEMIFPAVDAMILMSTQCRGVTGSEGAQNFPVMYGQTMRSGEVRQ
jgi:hypothetical protein